MYRGAGYDVSDITGMESDEVAALTMPDGTTPIPGSTDPYLDGADSRAVPPPHCVDLHLMKNLTMAALNFQKQSVAAVQNTFRQMKTNSMLGDGTGGILGGGSAACMLKIMTYFNTIAGILNSTLGLIAAVIMGVLYAVLNYVCEFVVTAINNLLASICLPVPNLGLNLKLPSLQHDTCAGISLQNFISVSGGMSGMPAYSIPNMSLLVPRSSPSTTTIPVF